SSPLEQAASPAFVFRLLSRIRPLTRCLRCPHSSAAEHFFGKEEVLGPIPSVGCSFCRYSPDRCVRQKPTVGRRKRCPVSRREHAVVLEESISRWAKQNSSGTNRTSTSAPSVTSIMAKRR